MPCTVAGKWRMWQGLRRFAALVKPWNAYPKGCINRAGGALGKRLPHVVVLAPQQLKAAPLVRGGLALAVLGAPGAPAAGAGVLAHAAPRAGPWARALLPCAVPRPWAPARSQYGQPSLLTQFCQAVQ